MGYDFSTPAERKIGSYLIEGEGTYEVLTSEKMIEMAEKGKTLEYEVMEQSLPMKRRDGVFVGCDMTATIFFEGSHGVVFMQIRRFWDLKDKDEAIALSKIKPKRIIHSHHKFTPQIMPVQEVQDSETHFSQSFGFELDNFTEKDISQLLSTQDYAYGYKTEFEFLDSFDF